MIYHAVYRKNLQFNYRKAIYTQKKGMVNSMYVAFGKLIYLEMKSNSPPGYKINIINR